MTLSRNVTVENKGNVKTHAGQLPENFCDLANRESKLGNLVSNFQIRSDIRTVELRGKYYFLRN